MPGSVLPAYRENIGWKIHKLSKDVKRSDLEVGSSFQVEEQEHDSQLVVFDWYFTSQAERLGIQSNFASLAIGEDESLSAPSPSREKEKLLNVVSGHG